MKCPVCGYEDSKVIDTRPTENGSIRRRRECLNCQRRFTTFEIIDTVPVLVVKKDGSREVFVKNKLLNGIIKACYKRPVSSDQMNRMVDNISQTVSNSLRHEIPSSELGGMVMEELRDIDEVSYVRFASVYREFKDAETFMEELYKLGGCRASESGQKENTLGNGGSNNVDN